MSQADSLVLQPFTLDSPYFLAAVELYASTWGHPVGTATAFIERYAKHPGFQGRIAFADDQVVGMGFGSNGRPGNWWYDKVDEVCGRAGVLHDAWVLVELCVHSDYRNRGIGSILMASLFDSVEQPHILLSTQMTNQDAQRLYVRHGFTYLHPGMAFAHGQPLYAVMALRRDLSKGVKLR